MSSTFKNRNETTTIHLKGNIHLLLYDIRINDESFSKRNKVAYLFLANEGNTPRLVQILYKEIFCLTDVTTSNTGYLALKL